MDELKAKDFALESHMGQKYGNREYSFHLESVVKIAKDMGLESDIIAGCWLHDTIEDCSIEYTDIKDIFGESIAEIVHAVTDEPGKDRKERKLKTYPKIKSNESAVCVKLCDRIANLNQSILDNKKGLVSMYCNEHDEFRQQLYDPAHNSKTGELWAMLENHIEKGMKMVS
ncbi:MAG: HD domain-containing protein [Cyclobacteriaceae bacterium]|nr:HD domain-containing protein [Cyclobacteriaceae bacterium]